MRGLQRIRELQAAMSAVAEVASALREDGEALSHSGAAGRAALGRGDRREWLLAEAQGEVARANMEKLKNLLARREAAVPPAMERFLSCRLEHEQTKVLAESAQQAADLEQAHREQAAADEWVQSRWSIVKGR
jgi:hypothetical protein